MSVPPFLGMRKYIEYINILLDHWKKKKKQWKAQFQYTKAIFINKYTYFLVFSTQIAIFRNLSHIDA